MTNKKLFSIGQEVRYSLINEKMTKENERLLKEFALERKDELSEDALEEMNDKENYADYFESDFIDESSKRLTEEETSINDLFLIGASFICLMNEKEDVVYSFTLTGYASEGVYTCVYVNS